ncbi:MAG TPA: DUF4386 domain-containing protein [Gemmatimonadaceae bacterium]|nr:DUF4386 domain-containing protein [Gemmatimonadaceae bacterium]
MTLHDTQIDSTQRSYARLAGLMYLLNYATSVFGALAPSSIRGSGDFAEQARRVLASQFLYRTALTSMAIGWVLIVALAFSLYVTLKPVNKRLAQLALFLELGQASVGAVTVIFSFVVLGLFTAFQPTGSVPNDQLQALVRVVERASGSGFNISMVFLAVGSTIFFWLFYKSRYVPRLLAGWGVFASVVMLFVSLAMLLFSERAQTLQYGWGPMGIAELATAFWLMIVGIRQPRVPVDEVATA